MSLSSTSFCKHDILWRSFFFFSLPLDVSSTLFEKRRKSSLLFCACFHLNSIVFLMHVTHIPSFNPLFPSSSGSSLILHFHYWVKGWEQPFDHHPRHDEWVGWIFTKNFVLLCSLLCIFFLLHQLLVSRWEKKLYPQSEQQEEGWEKSKKIKADINEVTRAEKMMMKRHTIEWEARQEPFRHSSQKESEEKERKGREGWKRREGWNEKRTRDWTDVRNEESKKATKKKKERSLSISWKELWVLFFLLLCSPSRSSLHFSSLPDSFSRIYPLLSFDTSV